MDAPLVVFLCIVVVVLTYATARHSGPVRFGIGSLGDRLILERTNGIGGTTDGAWFGDELAPGSSTGRARWSQAQSAVRIPYAGVARVTVEAAGWPGDGAQPLVTVAAGAQTLGTFTPQLGYQSYGYTLAEPSAATDVTVTLTASQVMTDAAGIVDPRQKGIRVAAITIEPAPNGALQLPFFAILSWYVTAFSTAVLALRSRARWLQALAGSCAALICALGCTVAGWQLAVLWPFAVGALVAVVLFHARMPLGAALCRVGKPWLRHVAVARAVSAVLVGLWLRAVIADGVAGQPWGAWLLGGLVIGGGLLLGATRWAAAVDGLLTRTQRLQLWLFFGALGGGVAAVVYGAPFIGHADYADNAVVARNLVAGRGWVVDYVTQFYQIYPTVTHPQETWPLLQPVWIALSFLVFGISDASARVPNLVFWGLLAAVVFRYARQRWGVRVGVVAVALLTVNIFVFRQLIYATTDIAFVAFATAAFVAVWQLAQPAHPVAQQNTRWSVLRPVFGAGVWTGLMLLQKPGSAAMLAVGMGLWLLWCWVLPAARHRDWSAVRVHIGRVAVWAGTALVIVAPYVIRNLLLFGSPAHTTESLDAWILEYTHWDAIYRVYAADGGIGSGDLPERSWLLRWGFDSMLHKWQIQYTVLQDYLLPSVAFLPAPFDTWGAAPAATGLLAPLGLWAVVVGLLRRTTANTPSLRQLIGFALLPYVLFMTVYWHANEPRYWVVLIPWMAIAAAIGICRMSSVVLRAVGNTSRVSLMVLTVVCVVWCVTPLVGTLQSTWTLDQTRTAADRDVYAFLRTQTPESAVMMTRVPWQLQWYSERGAVMIPADADAQTILRIARHYRATYLVLDSLQRPNTATRATIGRMLSDPAYGFTRVYQTRAYPVNDNGRAFTMQSDVYAFPADYAGVAPIR